MDLVQHHDLRRVLVHGLQRRHVHGAEAQRERQLLVVVDVLVAEEQDEVIEQGLPQHRHLVVGQREPQVDTAHLGTDGQGERPDLDARAHASLALLGPGVRPAVGIFSRY